MTLRAIVVWLLAAAIAASILHFGMIQFGGMDGSAALQAAWRFVLGHHPYEDYRTVAPVSYIVPGGIAFELFGVRWRSLVILMAIFASLTFVWQDALLRRAGLPDHWTLLLALMTQCVTTIPLGWWSYNQTTSVAGAVFAAAALAFAIDPASRFAFASLIGSMALLSWMKPNVAAMLLLGIAVTLLSSRRTRGRFLPAAVAAFVISVGALLAAGVNPLRMIASYAGASGRAAQGQTFLSYFLSTPKFEAVLTLQLLGVGLVALLVRMMADAREKERRALLPTAISVLCILAGVIAMGTNNDFNSVDAPLVATGFAMLTFTGSGPRHRTFHLAQTLFLAFALGGLTVLGLWFTVTRERIRSIGPYTFHQPGPPVRIIHPPFFEGMQAGTRFASVLREIESVMQQVPHGRSEVFFGPRMEFGYPAWGLVPAKRMGLWWTGTGEAGPEEIEGVRQALIRWNPRLAIFLRNDFTYMSPGARAFFDTNYQRFDGGNLTVYIRRN